MQKKILAFVLSIFVVSLFVLPAVVSAQNLDLGINYATYTGLGTKDVRETIARIINVALGLLGIVAVVIVLVGGFEWMTAGGNEEKTGEAKQRIMAGVIGLAIILSAYAIANFVVKSLQTATTS
ncbi:MAG: pilin [Patescibacteria group bacterium]